MRLFGRQRPAPAAIIAIVALIFTVGITAPAAGKLNGKKLKDGSVAGSKLVDDTLTGQQIDESTLAVPAGALAGSFNTGIVTASVGQAKPLLTLGPFSIEGRCAATTATIIITTNLDDSNLNSNEDELDNNDFDIGVEAQLGYEADTTSNHVAFFENYYSNWIAIGPNASSIFRGDAYTAKDFLGAPCTFMVVGHQLL
jgi:hypothetical protein